ncbi:MAG: hemolysin family protein [Gammaproteobacteria bacterium]
MNNILLILLALTLVLLNGFFVAAEFAIVKLRGTQIAPIVAIYGFRGRILATIHRHLDAYLSACQLGITLASLGLGWIGEPAFATLLEPILEYFNIFSPTTVKITAFFIAFLLISFLHIVVGELAPKSVAIRKTEVTSLWSAVPLYGFYWIMYPLIWLLNKSANLILRAFGISLTHDMEGHYSTEELRIILSSRHLHGRFAVEESQMLQYVLEFAERKVVDLMRTVEEMIALDLKKSLSENLKIITQHRFSRYPVFEEDINQIKGLIHVKDLFAELSENLPMRELVSIVRPILNVAADLPALELLNRFRTGYAHFAVVHSDRGAVVGFVTLDNLLGLLLGKIRDEFHRAPVDWLLQKHGTLLMKGNTPLYVLETALNVEIKNLDEKVNTIGGLIMTTLGRLPHVGEKLTFDAFEVVILKMRGPRILQVEIYPKKNTSKLT